MIHPRHRVAQIGVAVAFAGACTVAFAGLNSKPPEGLTLAGIEWQLDPYNSDDPEKEIERAGRQEERRNRPVFSDDDPLGRHTSSTDPIGSGRHSGGPLDRGNTGGNWPRGGNSADDPLNPAVSVQWGNATHGSIFFESLRKNPEKLSFNEGKQYVTVSADGLDTECEAGVKEPFSDSYGDGQRSCGWSGRAWVIETTRKQFSRTDRYELSKDGKTLKYTTSASENGVGHVTITRKYQLPPVR